MAATLLAVPASHPSMTARLMLARKGIRHRRVDLVPGLHRLIVRAAGFPAVSVPALFLEGQRLQGSRTISRALDALRPRPALFPTDRVRRDAVERAEAWGDEVLQPVARRLAWAALTRDRSASLSRTKKMPGTIVSSAAAKLVAKSFSRNRVRLCWCGWKTQNRRFGWYRSRSAFSVVRISVGWWP